MKNIILFASGKGSNVRKIFEYFEGRDDINFPLLVVNSPNAGVLEWALTKKINILLVNKNIFESPVILDDICIYKPDLLVLAGFLWKLPDFFIEEFPQKIVNIHPSLLPKYGGKGMFGRAVHEAVIQNGETESGITIHLVDENYDQGTILLQKKVEVRPDDTIDTLVAKIQPLEHEWYSKVIETLI